MKYKIVFFLLLFFPLISQEPELVVELETEGKLIPIHLQSLINQSSLSKKDADQLEEVLKFDLNHNAITALSEPKEAVYKLRVTLKDSQLDLKAWSKNEEVDVSIPYTIVDRSIVHQLADAFVKALFNQPGVASTRLLYTIRVNRDHSEVWESDYDGFNARQVTRNAKYAVTPTYLPPEPGAKPGTFFYVGYETGQPKIYVANLKDGIGKRFVNLNGNQLMPTISLQRDKFAFISDVTGNPDLFFQEFSPEKGLIGKPRQIYSAGFAVQGTPSFSPDGKKIAFVSDKGGTPRIYVMPIPPAGASIKDLKPTLISKMHQQNTAPNWSPDGTKIAYCSKIKGTWQICIYDYQTGRERQLTIGALNKENPCWAPNSLHLVYNTSDSAQCQLYMLNIKQSSAVKLTSGSGDKRFPVWQPKGS